MKYKLACILILVNVCALAQSDFLKPFSVDSFTYKATPRRLDYGVPRGKTKPSHFNLQSFGYSRKPLEADYEFSRQAVSDSITGRGLECPVCSIGPPNRTRATIAPFGADAKFTFLRGHVQFFAGFGGTETFKTDGMLQGLGRQVFKGAPLSQALGGIGALRPVRPDMSAQWGGDHLITNDQYNDQWLLQSHLGFRVFLDPQRNISLGVTKGYLYNNFNLMGQTGEWTSTKYDMTFTFGSGPSHFVARQLRKMTRKAARHSP